MNARTAGISAIHADWLPSVLVGCYMVTTSIAAFWLPVYFADQLGFSGAQIGLLFSINAIAGVVAALPAGLGNDRITSRNLVVAALATQVVAIYLLGGVRLFPAALIVFLVWSVANNLFRMSMEMQLLKTDTGARTGSRIGLFVAWRFGGLLAGTILAGYLLHWLDFRGSFTAVAVAGAVLIVPAFLLPPTRLAPVRLAEYFADLRDLRVLLFAGWMFLFTTHWGVESTCYSLFLRRALGLSLHAMGWYMAAEFAAVVVSALFVAPRLGKRFSLTTLALAGVLLSGIGHIGMTIHDVRISVAFRAVHGLGDGALAVLLYVGFSRLFNIERLGGNAGAINLAMMSGQIAGAMIAGPIGEKFGYALPIWTSGVLMIALAAPLAVKSWRDGKMKRIG